MKYLHEIDGKNEKRYLLIALFFHIIIISSVVYFKTSSNDELIEQAPESSLSDSGVLSDSNSSLDQEILDINHEKELKKLEDQKLNANSVSAKEVDNAVKTFNDNIKKEEQRKIAEKARIENEKVEAIKKEIRVKQEKIDLEKKELDQKNKKIKDQEIKNKNEEIRKNKLEKERLDNQKKNEELEKNKKERIEKIRKNEDAKRQKSIDAMKRASIEKQRSDQAKRISLQNKGYDSKTRSLSNSEKMVILKIYRDQVYNKVYSNWLRPSYSKRGWSCKAIINQSRNGTVNSVKIVNCQGDLNFQESVKKAIYKSSPLPLPKDTSLFNDTIEITFKVT